MQNQLSEEIVNAITSSTIGEVVDDADLEDELEKLQQEQLDNKMLETGTVPVSDAIHRLPAAANGESKPPPPLDLNSPYIFEFRLTPTSQEGRGRGRRRRSGAAEAAGRDGYVICMHKGRRNRWVEKRLAKGWADSQTHVLSNLHNT